MFLKDILAHPITKRRALENDFRKVKGILDARVFLKNTFGYDSWLHGQLYYEKWACKLLEKESEASYRNEIEGVRPVYQHFCLSGRILDLGGGVGRVREFLAPDTEFVSTDPWLEAPHKIGKAERGVYSCLNRPLNFIAATAEFQPFIAESFDWVHMRSMLDHVQVPDLVLLEAHRVLRPGGRILVGLYVEGGKAGIISLTQKVKKVVKYGLEMVGIDRWKDHHVWHPTYSSLIKLIQDNGFLILDTFWQPQWKDTVCYVSASKK